MHYVVPLLCLLCIYKRHPLFCLLKDCFNLCIFEELYLSLLAVATLKKGNAFWVNKVDFSTPQAETSARAPPENE